MSYPGCLITLAVLIQRPDSVRGEDYSLVKRIAIRKLYKSH